MNRPSWKCLVFCVVIVAASFVAVDQASAWGHGGCCGGSWYSAFPAYVSWDACCDSGWYYGYSSYYSYSGCCRRYAPYRAYAGWYGGCCYPSYYGCCSYPNYAYTYADGCCGGTVYGGGVGTVQGTTTTPSQQPTPAAPKKPVIETPAAPDTPATPAAPADTTTPAAPAPGLETPPADIPAVPTPSTRVTPENSGILTVWVPFDAKVTINGMATKSIGSRRQFVSYDLADGFSYKYEVKAEVVRDGKIVEDTKTVVITAGSSNSLAFGFNIPAESIAAAN